MRCRKGKLCENFVLSTSVTVVGTDLVVNIPAISCNHGCLAIAQAIPDAATVNMPVVITIGDGTTQYTVVDKCGVPLTAGRLDTRWRYPFKFISAGTSSVFKICQGTRCLYNQVPGIPV